MSQEIQVTMLASQAQLLNELAKQQMAIQKSIDKYQKLGQTSKQTTDTTETGINRVVGKLSSMAAGYLSVTSVINMMTAANKQANDEIERAATKVDDLERKFRIQSGLRGLAADNAQAAVEAISIRNAATPEQGYEGATQLVSSGATVDQVVNQGLLDSLIKGVKAMNMIGKDVGYDELAKTSIGYLNATGQELTAQNLDNMMNRLFNLFQGTNLQLGDLGPLAKIASGLTDRIESEEQFAATAVFKDAAVAPEEAATYLRNITGRLRTAGASDLKAGALKELGINPEQVDLDGETLQDVLALFERQTAGMDKARRDALFKKLFEEQGVEGFNTLLVNREKMARFVGLQQGREGYDSAVAEAQSGRNAGIQRLETSSEFMKADQDQMGALYGKALDEQMLATGYGAIPRYVAGLIYGGARLFGATPQQAVTAAAPTSFDGRMIDMEGMTNQRALEVMQANTAALEENNRLIKEQNQKGGMGAPSPPGPRPAQARSR